MREERGAKLCLGAAGATILPSKGLRTGSVEAPILLNALMAWLLRPTVATWLRQGVGWGGMCCASLLIWADNVWLLATSEHEAVVAKLQQQLEQMEGEYRAAKAVKASLEAELGAARKALAQQVAVVIPSK